MKELAWQPIFSYEGSTPCPFGQGDGFSHPVLQTAKYRVDGQGYKI
jgi:hypothetical protein